MVRRNTRKSLTKNYGPDHNTCIACGGEFGPEAKYCGHYCTECRPQGGCGPTDRFPQNRECHPANGGCTDDCDCPDDEAEE